MQQLQTLVSYLDNLLPPKAFTDSSLNGLQVDGGVATIKTVAVSVDAGLSVMEKATQAGANLLIVHHGMLWGQCEPISNSFGAKITHLIKNGCSLYASHLPLDAHPEVGNNFELGRFFELNELASAFPYKGGNIGVVGRCKTPLPVDSFVKLASRMVGATTPPLLLPFGPPKVSKVAIVSGGAASELEGAARLGAELFITGEPKQSAYHIARELKINALFAGHYATETFGVRALAKRLEKEFGLKAIFIDEPTGI